MITSISILEDRIRDVEMYASPAERVMFDADRRRAHLAYLRDRLNRAWSPFIVTRNGATFDPRCAHCHRRRSQSHDPYCAHPDAVEARRVGRV